MSRYSRHRRALTGALTAGILLVCATLGGTPAPASAANTLSMRGADVSSLQRSLDLGARYYDAGGVARDPLDILKSVGVNYVRLRVWNNPISGYNNKNRVLGQARAARAKGLRVLIDFHYSDTWADGVSRYTPRSDTQDS